MASCEKKKLENTRFQNKSLLWEAVKQAWEEIPIETCQNLINSMNRRMDAVIRNSGHATKY